MKKLFAIVAGEPNSINSEIIVKAWKKIKNKKNFFIIGNYLILKKQLNKINQKINISEINSVDKMRSNNNLNILNIPLNFKSIFKVNPLDAKKYILQSLNIAHNLSSSKKIIGFINLPVNKSIFKNKYLGVTEYLADKNNVKNNEVMMIHNKKLSVVPLTTHLDIKNITKNIKYNLIKKKIFSLNKSYKYLFKRKPIIVVL